MAVSDYSTTPSANTNISGINIAENCAAANMNDALRQNMADERGFWDAVFGTSGFARGGIIYPGNDANFTITMAGAGTIPRITFDSGPDSIDYDRAGNAFNLLIGGAVKHAFSATQHTINSDPVVTRTSTDSLTNKSFDSAPIPTVAGTAPGYFARGKCFGLGRGTNGTCTLNHAGNIASVTRTAAGTYAVVFTTNAPDANYVVIANARVTSITLAVNVSGSRTSSGFSFFVANTSTLAAVDPTEFDFVVMW